MKYLLTLFDDKQRLYRLIGVFGALLTTTAIAADLSRASGFGPKGISLALLGIFIVYVSLTWNQNIAYWKIKPGWFLFVIMMMAAGINAYLMIRNPNMGGDALWFHSSVHNLMAGNGYLNPYTDGVVEPGYGLLAYPFYLLFGNIELSGMLVSSISYILMIPTTFFAIDFLFGRSSAFFSTWLIAFWPVLLNFSYVNLSDTAFALFALLSFSVYIRILLDRNTFVRSVFLGLSLGMAYLLRESEGLWIACLVLLSLFGLAFFSQVSLRFKNRPWVSRLKSFQYPILSALIVSLAIIFYAILIHSQTGIWTILMRVSQTEAINQIPKDTPMPVDITVRAPSTEVVFYRVQYDENKSTFASPIESVPILPFQPEINQSIDFKISGGLDFTMFGQNFNLLLSRLFWMNLHAFAVLLLLWIVFPFVAKRKLFNPLFLNRRSFAILFAFAVYISPVMPLLVSRDRTALRYYLSDFVYILMVVSFLSARFLTRILESVNKTRFLNLGIFLLCLGSLVFSTFFGMPNLTEVLTGRHPHFGIRAAGLWLQENGPDFADITIVNRPKASVVFFYAAGQEFVNGNTMSIPLQSLKQISDSMYADQIDYLLLDYHYVHHTPLLETLWSNPEISDESGLTLLLRDNNNLFQIYSASPVTP